MTELSQVERDAVLGATVENPTAFVLPELEVVGATELRAGDEVLLRVDQVLQDPKTGRVELVGVESEPRLPEQMCVRARHPQVAAPPQSDHPGLTAEQIERTENRSGGISVPIQSDHGPQDVRADDLADFSEEALVALRELVEPLEDLPQSDRLLRMIYRALEVKGASGV